MLSNSEFDTERIGRVKVAYSVRRVNLDRPLWLVDGIAPRHGDLLLARVFEIGQHPRLELTTSRRAMLYPGDEIVIGMGARYAPDQFEAELPDDLAPCHLVAAGGVAAAMRCKHSSMKDPTSIVPVGLVAVADGRVLNAADGALPLVEPLPRRVPTVLVTGTAMNAGKTTSVISLVRGLTAAGLRIGACKLTGTGAGGDRYSFVDAGAAEVLDFTDLGLVSTFGVPLEVLVRTSVAMHRHLVARGVDVVLMEAADGLLCAETAALIDTGPVRNIVDGTVFAAGDAAGAVLGVQLLRKRRMRLLAVSGVLTASPLAVREVQTEIDLPVYGPAELADPRVALRMLRRVSVGERAAPRATSTARIELGEHCA
ncbi:MAG: DUF1611 domain-containing protein [Pseudonocardiales bacterium]